MEKPKKRHTEGWWRPRLIKTPEEFAQKVDEYFEYIKGEYQLKVDSDENGKPIDVEVCVRQPEPATITGLCLFMGFASKQSFYDYKKLAGFEDVTSWAHMRVEYNYEMGLSRGRPAGPIFALKNMGWSDKQEVDHTTNGNSLIPNIKWEFFDAEKQKK